MAVSIEVIRQLRDLTSASVSDCKQALDDARGDLKQAQELLKKRGIEIAAKKAARTANQGRVEAYIHTGNKIGVLLELNCETDFVARNDDFIRLARDVAMQVAAADPRYARAEDVPEEEIRGFDEKAKKDYLKAHVLACQPYIRDEKITIQDLVTQAVAKIGENIVIRRFIRYKVGA
ncbi:MAG: elongation factor Ts [Deltaproteobacteria bacterium]